MIKKYKNESAHLDVMDGVDAAWSITVKRDFFGREGAQKIRKAVEDIVNEWYEDSKLFEPGFCVCIVFAGKHNNDELIEGASKKVEAGINNKNSVIYAIDRWQKRYVVDVAVRLRQNKAIGTKITDEVKQEFDRLKVAIESV
jgi:hypothetical protein